MLSSLRIRCRTLALDIYNRYLDDIKYNDYSKEDVTQIIRDEYDPVTDEYLSDFDRDLYYIARDYRFSDSRISKYEKEAADIIHTSRTNLRSKKMMLLINIEINILMVYYKNKKGI